MLRDKRAVSSKVLMSRLGVSISTLKRDLDYMKDRLGAPIEWDRVLSGYRYAHADSVTPFALPGFWLHADEIHALLIMRALLSTLGSDLVSSIVAPFVSRLERLVKESGIDPETVSERFRVQSLEIRRPEPETFGRLATAAVKRKQAHIRYFNRAANTSSDRTVSPQRLIFHRGKWYIDAWCHLRRELRRFAIDATCNVEVLDEPAKELVEGREAESYVQGYGIFGGMAVDTARLRFSARRARWVVNDQWHPDQKSSLQADGSLLVEVPYGDDRELIRDLLRHGSDVEVLGPASLRERLREEVGRMSALYRVNMRSP
jgi:predicted DNA-binding transcriptional regulator YafY